MSEGRIDLLTRLPIASIEKLRTDALHAGDTDLHVDAAHALNRKSQMQTDELSDCAQLFAHHHPPSPYNGWRGSTTFTGDPLAWMAPFMTGGQVGKINREAGIVKKETISLRAGERAVVVRADGSMRT